MGFKDKFKKTARETAEKITEGKLPTQHLGKFTAPMIEQELFSLANTKPAFRDTKFADKFDEITKAIMEKLSRNQNSIMCQVWLKTLEKIKNER